MIVLALLLLAAAIFVIIAAVIEGGGAVTVGLFDYSLDTTVLGVFLVGLVTGLFVLAGLVVLAIGIRQAQARRREIEYLRQKVAEQESTGSGDDDVDESPRVPPAGRGWPEQRFARRGQPADL